MNRFFFSTEPVLIPSYVNTDKRFAKYSFEFLRQHCGDIEVLTQQLATGAVQKFLIREYLDYMDQPTERGFFYMSDWQYWRHQDIFSEISPLLVTENWLDYLPVGFIPKLAWMFVGRAGTYSSLHVDLLNTSAWNLLFEGEKRWLFFPPDFKFLDSDLNDVDLNDEYYRKNSQIMEFRQRKGDLIFTPSGWYHQVFNDSHSFAITENFLNAANYDAVFNYFDSRSEVLWVKLLSEIKAVFSESFSG